MLYLQKVALPQHHKEQLQTYLLLYHQLMDQITPLTESIHKMAQSHPIAKLLITIPGIGPITAMTIIAEIENITRFPSYRHLSSYAGLVPSLKASAGKQRIGKITKQGSPYLRTALIEAAQCIARMKKCRINLFFRRIIVRSGYKKAIVATAHKILQIVFYVWKNKTPYQEVYHARA